MHDLGVAVLAIPLVVHVAHEPDGCDLLATAHLALAALGTSDVPKAQRIAPSEFAPVVNLTEILMSTPGPSTTIDNTHGINVDLWDYRPEQGEPMTTQEPSLADLLQSIQRSLPQDKASANQAHHDLVQQVAKKIAATQKIDFRRERLLMQYHSWITSGLMSTFILLRIITGEKKWRRAALYTALLGTANNLSARVVDAVIAEQEKQAP